MTPEPSERAAVAAVLRPALWASGLDAAVEAMRREAGADGDDAFAFALAPGLVVGRTVAALAARTPLATARAFAAWTERPDVAPFLSLDRRTCSSDVDAEVDAFFEAGTPVDPVRYRLVREMLAKTDALRRAADLAVFVLTAAIQDAEADLPVEEQTPVEDVVPDLLGPRDALAESMRGEMEDVYTVLYHGQSVEAIRAYLAALDDPAARWFEGTVWRAFGQALRQTFAEAAAVDDED